MNERAISNILSGLVCLLLGTVIFVVLITGQKSGDLSEDFSSKNSSGRVLKVNTVKSQSSDSLQVNRSYTGLIQSKEAVDLSFQRGGRIDRITVAAGDTVKKDQILAELDSGTDLVAPFAGVIAAKRMTIGSVASPGVPVFRLVKPSDLEAWFSLPVDVAEDISTGDSYDLELDGKKYQIVASGVLPEIDQNGRTRTVFFSLPAKISENHLPGETVTLQLPKTEEVQGFWLPLTALTRETRGMWSIYVVKNGKIDRQFVEVHHVENDRAWIRGKVDPNAQIVADGTHRVVPGQQVTAVDKAD
ncbi:MAG: HlyD family efflux transporter periplasmic adaptor subunit [Verrucomicrobiales bacterium]|nr:HlyD family efflux transporter periplasmic adaptor subunit [Verrucomicrobiales bacterium]